MRNAASGLSAHRAVRQYSGPVEVYDFPRSVSTNKIDRLEESVRFVFHDPDIDGTKHKVIAPFEDDLQCMLFGS